MHFLSDTSLDRSVDSNSRAIHEHKKTCCLLSLSYLGKLSYAVTITVGLHNSDIRLKNKMLRKCYFAVSM